MPLRSQELADCALAIWRELRAAERRGDQEAAARLLSEFDAIADSFRQL